MLATIEKAETGYTALFERHLEPFCAGSLVIFNGQ